jgi:antitoxin component of MazEF toxin-antitoxin module
MIIKPKFTGKLIKVGNSYMVTVPMHFVNLLDADRGDVVEFEIKAIKHSLHPTENTPFFDFLCFGVSMTG